MRTTWTCGACGESYRPNRDHDCVEGQNFHVGDTIVCAWGNVVVCSKTGCQNLECDGRPDECPLPPPFPLPEPPLPGASLRVDGPRQDD